MGVYITTSKSPSRKTKALCEVLLLLLPGSVLELRGKKSIEQVFRRAKLLGKRRVVLVYEKSGIPSKICVMDIKAHSWDWIGKEVLISDFHVYKLPKQLPDEIAIREKGTAEFGKLLDFEECKGDDRIEMSCEDKSISFSYKGKPLLRMELM